MTELATLGYAALKGVQGTSAVSQWDPKREREGGRGAGPDRKAVP